MNLNKYDQYFYENSLTQLLSNHNTSIFISETDKDRVEKTKMVVDSPYSKDFLYVCASDIYNEKFNLNYQKDKTPNCSECIKCIRTMMTIDLLGAREQFKDRFDFHKLDVHYKKHLLNMPIKRDTIILVEKFMI